MNKIVLSDLTPFSDFNEDELKLIEKNYKLVKYELGQVISTPNIIQSSIIFIMDGKARIIGSDANRKKTIGKLSKNDCVGLISLLRGTACEQINAITPILALEFKDTFILDFYKKNTKFNQWVSNYISISELYDVVSNSNLNELKNKINDPNNLELIKNNSELITIDEDRLKEFNKEEYSYFVSSSNIKNHEIGESIENLHELEWIGPLPARLIKISKSVLSREDLITEKNEKEKTSLNFESAEIAIAPEQSTIPIGNYNSDQKFKLIKGNGLLEETLACMQMLSREMKLPFRKDAVEKTLRDFLQNDRKPSIQLCGAISTRLGLHASIGRVPSNLGTRLQTPSLISWGETFAIVTKSNASGLHLASPSKGFIFISANELEENFPEAIDLLIVDRTNSTPNQDFGLGWFWPSIKKFKASLIQVFFASFIVQLFGLANPLLIQIIIDKVISQRSLDTLQILGIALVFVTILGGIIGSLRTFLFTETTNRIDTRLGAEVIDHLLRLPLNYFDKRPVGELSSRVSELEKIRNFLTGQALTTILDAAFSIIYIIVMFVYSLTLTIAALSVVPIQILITLLGAPIIRRQIREIASQNAKTQSHLVEVLTGVQTVKAQNVETVTRWKWQDLYNKYISKTFDKTITGTSLGQLSTVMQQLSQLIVLWLGATLVLNGQLTLGQLIAFRIISGYVTQPLLRLSTIWQNVQELRVSFERLSDIIDTPEESNQEDKANIPLPNIKGNVQFKNVNFSFENSERKVLNNICLDIKAGTFVGVVGQSGSGKSTLMKLIPRLYNTKSGKILIDGYDINKVELYSLRRQIGIVPQDPLLFAGSVTDNIALTNPEVDSEDIKNAAKIANAHEFIMDLPIGYSSDVGERGAGLSGGQRQRLAIARTILMNPNMLILDEATSALDYQTERIVCENLRKSCEDTTVFFITHRLSTIKNADIIIMLDNGVITEVGKHEELINKKGMYYALYKQQGD